MFDGRRRNQGIGRRLCAGLMHWGCTFEQAETAYLAVMQSNAAALHLYAQLGFREQYTLLVSYAFTSVQLNYGKQ